MQDGINLLMLVCATLAALTLGVLAAYSCCRIGFVLLGMHARSVAEQRIQAKARAAIA